MVATRAGTALLALVLLAGCDPDDIGPGQKPLPPRAPVSGTPRVGYPVRPGDSCAPAGATAHTSTGATVTCGRHGGLDHDTWG